MQLVSSVLKSLWIKRLTIVAAETGLSVQRLQLNDSTSVLAVHVHHASSEIRSRKGCSVCHDSFLTLQGKLHRLKNSWLKEKPSRYWMPLTTLTITTQGNHCVRHSEGSYQSREISHTDIHSHARTHVRDSMHCFGKFWSHNTSIFSSTSCNWQPCLAPHGITQRHLKWERKERKKKIKSYVMVFKCIQSKGRCCFFWKVYLYLKASSKMKADNASWTTNNNAQLWWESVHIHPRYCASKEENRQVSCRLVTGREHEEHQHTGWSTGHLPQLKERKDATRKLNVHSEVCIRASFLPPKF